MSTSNISTSLTSGERTEEELDQWRRGFTTTKVEGIEKRYWQEIFCSMVDCKWLRPCYNTGRSGEPVLVWGDRGHCGHWNTMVMGRSIKVEVSHLQSYRGPQMPICFSYHRLDKKPEWVDKRSWYYATKDRDGTVKTQGSAL